MKLYRIKVFTILNYKQTITLKANSKKEAQKAALKQKGVLKLNEEEAK